MLAPYSDNNSTSGLLTTEPDVMREKIKQAWRHGWQVVRIDAGALRLNSHISLSERTCDRRQGQSHRVKRFRGDSVEGTLVCGREQTPPRARADTDPRRFGADRAIGRWEFRPLHIFLLMACSHQQRSTDPRVGCHRNGVFPPLMTTLSVRAICDMQRVDW